MKNIKKIIAMIMIVTLVFSVCNTNVVFATEQTTEDGPSSDDKDFIKDEDASESDGKKSEPPEEKDWTDEENIQDVWDVFTTTNWNEVNVTFITNNNGIEYLESAEQYESFKSVFEEPIVYILNKFDEEERGENGPSKNVIGMSHKYEYIEYEKIIAMILYGIYIRQGMGMSEIYSFNNPNGGERAGLDETKDAIINSVKGSDKYQIDFIEQSKTFYMYDSWERYAKKNLKYNNDNIKSSMWGEPMIAYFGHYGATSTTLENLVKTILKELLKNDGKKITVTGSGEDGSYTFYFNPYEVKDFYNYLQLESMMLKTNNGKSLFSYCVNSDNFFDIYNEFTEKTNDTTFLGEHYNLPLYTEMYNQFVKENYDNIYFCKYNSDRLVNADSDSFSNTLSILFYVNKENINNGDSTYLHPCGSEGSSDSLGNFYYSEYKAIKVLEHKINGKTGEIIE